MGNALLFSQLEKFLNEQAETVPGCIVDTQFLIAILYEVHPFYEDADFVFRVLAKKGIPIFATVTTRSEFIDIQRKIIITEVLMDMAVTGSQWRLNETVKKELKRHKTWIDQQAKKDGLPILTDKRIKDCKEVFFPTGRSGKSGWLEICDHYLAGKLLASWEKMADEMGINYLELRKDEKNPFVPGKVQWRKMYEISERTCLGTSDAMILNMLGCSIFPFVVSADFDMAYSVKSDTSEKVIFIPDSLYLNKIQKLKF